MRGVAPPRTVAERCVHARRCARLRPARPRRARAPPAASARRRSSRRGHWIAPPPSPAGLAQLEFINYIDIYDMHRYLFTSVCFETIFPWFMLIWDIKECIRSFSYCVSRKTYKRSRTVSSCSPLPGLHCPRLLSVPVVTRLDA